MPPICARPLFALCTILPFVGSDAKRSRMLLLLEEQEPSGDMREHVHEHENAGIDTSEL